MQEKVKEIRGLDTGIIRMGTLASISAHWMPKILKGFHSIYPGVELWKTEPPIYRAIAIGYKDAHNLPIASKRFIEHLQTHLSELP